VYLHLIFMQVLANISDRISINLIVYLVEFYNKFVEYKVIFFVYGFFSWNFVRRRSPEFNSNRTEIFCVVLEWFRVYESQSVNQIEKTVQK
jgi:hypothetical protein